MIRWNFQDIICKIQDAICEMHVERCILNDFKKEFGILHDVGNLKAANLF